MTEPKVIRNTAGGASRYTVAPDSEAGHYLVRDSNTGHTWTIAGWRASGEHSDAVTKEPGKPRKLPAYVLAEVGREWAADALRESLPPGTTVYTVLRHVTSTGMGRSIDVYAIEDDAPVFLTNLAATVLRERVDDKHGGIAMGGYGMDMGFALVYGLGSALYRGGFHCTGAETCPSNDHSNDYGEFSRTYDEQQRAAGAPEWLTSESYHSADQGRSDDERERQRAYRKAKLVEWERTTGARYSRHRLHSDGGYALRQRWL